MCVFAQSAASSCLCTLVSCRPVVFLRFLHISYLILLYPLGVEEHYILIMAMLFFMSISNIFIYFSNSQLLARLMVGLN